MSIEVSSVQITTKDGRNFRPRWSGAIPGPTSPSAINSSWLKAIAFGDSDALEVGDFVVAIGNPFGLGQTVTSGLVSALGRTGLGKQGYEDFIQTDAAINPGNSGGALVNLKGELIGINSAIMSPGGGNVGIGFAIADQHGAARDGADRRERPRRARSDRHLLARNKSLRRWRTQRGRADRRSQPRFACGTAGLRKGDIVLKADDRPIHSAAQLRNRMALPASASRYV